MAHIVVAGKLHPAGLNLLARQSQHSYKYIDANAPEAYIPHVHAAEALVIRTQPLSAATIALASKLQIVSRHGVGYDTVDTKALWQSGAQLCIVGDVNSRSVAEHTMLLLLAAARRVRAHWQGRGQLNWDCRNSFAAGELYAKTLLIIGYGRIGRQLAQMASAFGMEIIIYDPFAPADPASFFDFADNLPSALGRADALSIHVPYSGASVITAAELALLKPGAIVVNTARGGLIDEQALLAALQSGQVAAAALDVLEQEPPSADNPLLALDNVLITPHMAGLTAECAERMALACVQNVLDFFDGKLDPKLIVQPPCA